VRGNQQSPVNIQRTGLQEIEYPPLEFSNYSTTPEIMMLKNTGNVLEMTINSSATEATPSISGGGLPNVYQLAKIIFHWGQTSGSGSEHTKSFTSYPMEVQLVHFKDSFGNIETALSTLEWDSLAIVSILFFTQLANTQAVAPYMDIVSNALHKITQPDTETQIQSFPISSFLPDNQRRFYRYNGSLTQPPCSENVVWTVLAKPSLLLVEQLVQFSELKDRNGNILIENVRPLQPILNRTILSVKVKDSESEISSESLSTTDQSSTLRFELNLIQLWAVFFSISFL